MWLLKGMQKEYGDETLKATLLQMIQQLERHFLENGYGGTDVADVHTPGMSSPRKKKIRTSRFTSGPVQGCKNGIPLSRMFQKVRLPSVFLKSQNCKSDQLFDVLLRETESQSRCHPDH